MERKHIFVPDGEKYVICPFCKKVMNLNLYHEDLVEFYLQTCEHLAFEDFLTPTEGGADVWFEKKGKTKTFILWETEDNHGYLLDPAKITEMAYFENETVILFPEIKDKERLQSLLLQIKEKEEELFELEELFESKNIKIEIVADEFIEPNGSAYLVKAKELIDLKNCETVPVYEYWDGSNFKKIVFDDETMTQYEVVVNTETAVDLDEWDGSNFYFRSKNNHGILYEVIAVDGFDPDKEQKYLLEQYTDFAGDIPTGTFLTEEEARELLESR